MGRDTQDICCIYFMNIKFTVTASDTILQDIWSKYMSLLTTLVDAGKELELLSSDPEKAQISITDQQMIPQKMTKIWKYFQTTSRPPKENEADMWSIFWIKLQDDLDDLLQSTEYDLRDKDIVLM